jgi:hypothetical protein
MQLLDEVGVVRELELPDAMRLQPVRSPDALNRAGADAGLLRHHGGGPVRGLSWRIGLRECHHACRNVRSEWRNARYLGAGLRRTGAAPSEGPANLISPPPSAVPSATIETSGIEDDFPQSIGGGGGREAGLEPYPRRPTQRNVPPRGSMRAGQRAIDLMRKQLARKLIASVRL